MSLVFEEKNRNIIPRWRNSNVAFLTDEFGSSVKESNKYQDNFFLNEKKNIWLQRQDLPSAIELVYSAQVLKEHKDIESAAEIIIKNQDIIPKQILNIANEILKPSESNKDIEIPQIFDDYSFGHNRIRILKKKLIENPRNSVARIDLAREYTILGQFDKAMQNIRLALFSNQANRFIIRNVVRFFIHVGNVEFAKYILDDHSNIINDPWLVAAEIACSSILQKSSKNTKRAVKLLENRNFLDSHLTELAVALGTQEFIFGDFKKARKFFKKAQIHPNENSIAQMVWVNQQFGEKDFQINTSNIAHLNEAFARDYFQKGYWLKSMEQSIIWFTDQPFSRRPAYFSTYVASGLLEDYNTAIRLGEISLRSNPNDFTILNNVAFSYASSSKVTKAEYYFSKINELKLDTHQKIVFNATKGLIYFRKKDFLNGYNFYKQSMEIALKNKLNKYAIRAAIYLERELSLFETPSDFNLINFVERNLKNENEFEIIELKKRIDNLNKISKKPVIISKLEK